MPYDANLILRGQYSSAYVDLDENDAAPTTTTANNDGNAVVDLGVAGTGALGLDCIVLFHDDPTTYQDTLDIVIQDSEHLSAGYNNLLTFPRVYCYMREMMVTATTAFVAADIGQVLTALTDTATGIIRQFSRNLLAVGGIGKVWVEMQDAGDTYATAGDTLTSAGTGVGTQGAASRRIQTALTLVRRFSTPKRYIRFNGTSAVSAGGNFGDVDILVTGSQHSHVNNLYH